MPGPGGPKVAVRHGQRVAFAAEDMGFFWSGDVEEDLYICSLMSQWPTCIDFFWITYLYTN